MVSANPRRGDRAEGPGRAEKIQRLPVNVPVWKSTPTGGDFGRPSTPGKAAARCVIGKSAHARRGNFVGVAGQAARAVVEEANAVHCEKRLWVCNEKRLIEAAGLAGVQALFGRIP